MKTQEQVKEANKKYFARPDVIEKERIKNARPEMVAKRKAYKKSQRGKAADKASRKRNWDKNAPLRDKQLLWRYGLTVDAFNLMLSNQDNACAICYLVPDKRLHVDHCHKTSKVRGLLCASCNMAIGLLKDDVNRLQAAINYLK